MAKPKKAKSKIVIDDEDLPEEQAEEEAVEEEAAEEEAAEEDVDEEEPEEEVESEKAAPRRGPKPRVTTLTMVFILLNWVAVPAFMVFAYLDYITHLQYAHRTLLNYVEIWGLPLRAEEDFPSLSVETRPRLRLSPEQLKAAFRERKGTDKSVNQEFVPVEEPVPIALRPSDLSDRVLKDIFTEDPVATLEDEIERFKKRIDSDIDREAAAVVASQKDEAQKRETLRKVWLPLAADVWMVKKLDTDIAKLKGADLDTRLKESVQRQLYNDILAPLNVFQPGDLTNADIHDIAVTDLDKVKETLRKRLESTIADNYTADSHFGDKWDKSAVKRDSVEKRAKVAFVLFTLSQVQVPTQDKKLLYPKGVERAQTVCGIYEFTGASIQYVQALRELEVRIVESVKAARDGYITELKLRTDGYIDQHKAEIDQIVQSAADNEVAQKRLDELKNQLVQFQKLNGQRIQQHADALEKLLAARKNTEKYVKELRDYQEQLFRALVELSDAAERNFALEARIREIELGYYKSKKGGQK